jgi:hypothetical protein
VSFVEFFRRVELKNTLSFVEFNLLCLKSRLPLVLSDIFVLSHLLLINFSLIFVLLRKLLKNLHLLVDGLIEVAWLVVGMFDFKH